MKKIILVSILAAIVLSIQPKSVSEAKPVIKKPAFMDVMENLFYLQKVNDTKKQELEMITKALNERRI